MCARLLPQTPPSYSSFQPRPSSQIYNVNVVLNTVVDMLLLLFLCSRVRALGTAAVSMCQVATGAADIYYHIGMHCWDIAASALIVQEAGGVVMDTDGLCVM